MRNHSRDLLLPLDNMVMDMSPRTAKAWKRTPCVVRDALLPISLWDLFGLNFFPPLPRGLPNSMFVPMISGCCFGKAMFLSENPKDNT